jgi:hypothetical protein
MNREDQTHRRAQRITDIAHTLNEIDRELEEISQTLREIQPKRPGALTLSFYDCGDDCIGCPHPRWLQWSKPNTPDKERHESTLAGHPVRYPAMRVKRTGDFMAHAPAVRRLVARANRLSAARAKIIGHTRYAYRAAHAMAPLPAEKPLASVIRQTPDSSEYGDDSR